MMYAAGSPSLMLSYDMTMLKRTSAGITPLLLSGLALDVTELLCRRMQVPVVVSRHSSALHVAQPVRFAIDLSLPEDELIEWTKAKIATLPDFQPADQWFKELAKRLPNGGL